MRAFVVHCETGNGILQEVDNGLERRQGQVLVRTSNRISEIPVTTLW